MVIINNGKTRAEQLIEENQAKAGRAEQLLRQKFANSIPEVSNRMARGVSDERREMLELQMENNEFREQGSGFSYKSSSSDDEIKMTQTRAGIVTGSSNGLYKIGTASSVVSSSSSGWRGSGDTARQLPEVYSPLWLNSNLNLPRDRAAINAWCRSFFALNPLVHNAITLHSTYPIAKLNIKCKNQKVEKFFNQMNEEIDLMNICVLLAQEYWVVGEGFVYAELDESKGSWSRLMILNPDYVNVQRSVIAAEPIISLRPDENLRRVVFGNQSSDIQQRQQLDPSIIEHVRRNENIPLNNLYVSHIARKIAPFEVRGTGLIVPCFRALMLFDKLRECHDEETEVLTKSGWKKVNDFTKITTNNYNVNGQYVNGIALNDDGSIGGVIEIDEDLEVACFNSETESIEYHKPEEFHMSQYNGEMIHFSGDKVDVKVTPNHKMWARTPKTNNWQKIKAQEIFSKKNWHFRSHAKWSGKKLEKVNVCGYYVPADIYLKVLGYVLSEGCVYSSSKPGRYDNVLILSQLTSGEYYHDMQKAMNDFSCFINKTCTEDIRVKGAGYSQGLPKEIWSGRIHGKDLVRYLLDEIGNGESAKSEDKRIPRWIMELCPEQLQVLLDALVAGDGSINRNSNSSERMVYNTISKQLADDVYEIAFKCGFVPNLGVYKTTKSDGREVTEYKVFWSTTNYGKEPVVYTGVRERVNGGGALVEREDYNGLVWCFTVPTGLFVTRRNGKVTIQGNSKYAQADNMVNPLTLIKIGDNEFRPSPIDLEKFRDVFESAQYDKDFKIFTHNAVDIQRIGYGQGIYDISGDLERLVKEIYVGLMVPSVIMDGSDTTYATGSVALDVLRQRYIQFRQYITSWLRNRIFAPISQINDFYEYIDGEKVLIVPDVDWNHMSLFDMDSYIQNMVNLSQGEGIQKRVSLQTLYRSLGLEYEEEQRKIRYEDINDAIRMKEMGSLARYSLSELRSLGPGDEINEVKPTDEPVPGQSAFITTPTEQGAPGMGPGPGAPGGPPMPGAPPPAPIGGGGLKPPGGGKPPTAPPGGGAPPPPPPAGT